MNDDLVTRLKDGFAVKKVIGGYSPDIAGTVQIMTEAADRIEADAATIARLEGERDAASDLALTLQAECEGLHGDVAAAEAKVAALVEALEWIMALNDQAKCCGKDYSECCHQPEYGLDRAQRVARNARAAIAAANGANVDSEDRKGGE